MHHIMPDKCKRVLGVGSPLLDILAPVEECFLAANIDGEKGGMMLTASENIDRVVEMLDHKVDIVPGGAAGNTVFALAELGMPVAMLGKTGCDRYGEIYCGGLQKAGGSTEGFFTTETIPTGKCLSLITPDGERTMRTFFGASSALTPDEVKSLDFSRYSIVYIEGYQLFHRQMIDEVLIQAQNAGCRIALDLASFEVVNQFKADLIKILENYIDLVFANEEEAAALLGSGSPQNHAAQLARMCDVAAVKLGRGGAVIAVRDRIVPIKIEPVEPVDTTAAGDLWAAGFLYGYLNGKPLEICGKFASITAREVVQVVGSKIPEEKWQLIRNEICQY